ncbi:MAG: hypothetical protein EOM23_07060 [Candidatus Moranbacteria bacterium]|nr:hypothetical protein [Candidatus Moranbacteria bacterium]
MTLSTYQNIRQRNTPYIAFTRCDGAFSVKGQAHAEFGHALDIEGSNGISEGIFASWDWSHDRLVVENDRYKGLRHYFTPFLDHELFDYMMSLKIDLKLDRTFHADAI